MLLLSLHVRDDATKEEKRLTKQIVLGNKVSGSLIDYRCVFDVVKQTGPCDLEDYLITKVLLNLDGFYSILTTYSTSNFENPPL